MDKVIKTINGGAISYVMTMNSCNVEIVEEQNGSYNSNTLLYAIEDNPSNRRLYGEYIDAQKNQSVLCCDIIQYNHNYKTLKTMLSKCKYR